MTGLKQYSMEALLSVFQDLKLGVKTIQHAPCPTCEAHTEALKGHPDMSKFVQAKNLFFKVPSKGGPLKDRLFLVCAAVDTAIDNKKLSARLGVKASAPLRLAADDVFDSVLQIPKGSVNPFVMINESAKEVTLLLDSKFQGNTLLFHPMQNDYTTSITSAELDTFLKDKANAKGRFMYVDFASDAEIKLDEAAATADKPATENKPKKEAPKQPEVKKEPTVQTKFADDHLFCKKPAAETVFSIAFAAYNAKQ